MTRPKISSLAGAVAVAAGTLLMLIGLVPLQTGCETQSADDRSIRVEPHSIGLRINQSANFTATGGFTYKWSLSDPSLGVLTRSDGPTTTYISRFNPEPNAAAVVQRLTVTSTVGGSDSVTDTTSGTTNTTSTGFIDTDEAIIEHLPTGDDGTIPGTTTTTSTATTTTTTILASLSVSPDTVTLTSGQSRTFTASGAGPTYSWSLSNASLGSLNTSSGSTVTYTANNATILTPTDVTLTVTSDGDTAEARITRL